MKLAIFILAFIFTALVVTASQLVAERPQRVRVPAPTVHRFKKQTGKFLRYM